MLTPISDWIQTGWREIVSMLSSPAPSGSTRKHSGTMLQQLLKESFQSWSEDTRDWPAYASQLERTPAQSAPSSPRAIARSKGPSHCRPRSGAALSSPITRTRLWVSLRSVTRSFAAPNRIPRNLRLPLQTRQSWIGRPKQPGLDIKWAARMAGLPAAPSAETLTNLRCCKPAWLKLEPRKLPARHSGRSRQ